MILSFQPCCSNCAASIKLKLPFFTIDFFPTSKNSVQFCTWYRILYDLNLYVTGSISTIFYISLLFLILCLTWIVVIPFKWGFTNASSLKLHPMVVSCCDTSPPYTKTMAKMAPRKKTHGGGAIISALIKFLHPSTLIREKNPNPKNCQRLEGCKML